MPKELRWKAILIIITILLSLWLIYPTGKYYYLKKNGFPGMTEKQKLDLYLKTIIPGLDLQGGLDIQLSVNINQVAEALVINETGRLNKNFGDKAIGAKAIPLPAKSSIQIELVKKEDWERAIKVLDGYKDYFMPWSEGDLKEGKVVLTISKDYVEKYREKAIDRSEMVIQRRVDEFGVTQPSVARQGTTRIRVQLPGTSIKDISSIFKPALLEFKLLNEENEKIIAKKFDEKGNLSQGESLPEGFELLRGEMRDPDTDKVVKDVPYIVKKIPEITGDALKESWVTINPGMMSAVTVQLEFKPDGARLFKDITRRYLKQRLAIVLDNYVYSAPVINTVIPDGRCYIEGDFTAEEANKLSQVLNAGALPAELKIEGQREVGATLGKDSIQKGMRATFISAIIVLAFMIIYYGFGGIIADIALILNILMLIAALAALRATLTLPGIAGIALTIGMSVDANVLILERIREELRAGKSLKIAVAQGYSRAFVTIFDSNMTTIITALVLLQFGTGPIQGFALTLTFGLIANLFTAVFVTRVITDWYLTKRNKLSLGIMHWLRDVNWNFMSKRFIAFAFSIALTVTAIFTFATKGLNYGIEFEGGVLSEVQFNNPMDIGVLRKTLEDNNIKQAVVQRVGSDKGRFIIRQKLMGQDLSASIAKIEDIIKNKFGNYKPEILGSDLVGPEVGKELIRKAITAIFWASLCIFIYILLRFRSYHFSVGAVASLLHDIIITLGLITLLKIDMSLNIVAALLTIMGYSVNDTIVVFDRIRENLRGMRGKPFRDLLNISMNETLSRTIITGLTTIFVLIIFSFFGGEVLFGFAITLLIGTVFGTYSSIFIATAIVYIMSKEGIPEKPKKKEEVTTTV